DRNGYLWFGGDANAGLSRYDGNSFTQFSKKDGLLNASIWSILEDKNGNIWVGTRETGLYLFDGEKFLPYSGYKMPSPDTKRIFQPAADPVAHSYLAGKH